LDIFFTRYIESLKKSVGELTFFLLFSIKQKDMNSDKEEFDWIEGNDETEEEYDFSFSEYDISAAPNDFNIKTLFDFIDSGIVKIPGFQRNYVWDISRASKLIESIIIGIPIPQIFLYEESRNKFIVIDGQQRYMTIYYFMKKRFPKKDKRFELRKIFDVEKGIPKEILNNNEFFSDFNLRLPEKLPNKRNKLNRLNYYSLDDDIRTTFELRTIRNIIIKQNFPEDDDSVVFEIFNRLNSGGVNLKPQEIRSSLYHSDFYEMLYQINLQENWRRFTPTSNPDLHMRDVEILLRGYAMLIEGTNYKPSMTKFLNKFSDLAKKYQKENIEYLKKLFEKFISNVSHLGNYLFFGNSNRFNVSTYEAIFVACCKGAFEKKNLDIKIPSGEAVQTLKEDKEFLEAIQSGTARTSNVKKRIERAELILD
jgi:hypothetical protein